MKIQTIHPPIYEKKYRPEINFKSTGAGIVLGWSAGTIAGLSLTGKKAIEEEIVLPHFINSIIVFLTGLSGGLIGHWLEKLITKK